MFSLFAMDDYEFLEDMERESVGVPYADRTPIDVNYQITILHRLGEKNVAVRKTPVVEFGGLAARTKVIKSITREFMARLELISSIMADLHGQELLNLYGIDPSILQPKTRKTTRK